MPASSRCRTHHRRVNPRFSVFRSFDHENTFYCDEEIPVTRRMNSGILPLNPRTNRFSLDDSIENDYLQSFEIPAVVAEDESEDNYILLRTIQPKIKIALIQTQDVWRSSGFRKNKKRPMLSKDPGLKYYSRRVQHAIPESPIEGDSVEDSNLSSLSLNSPSSNDADESSYENDQSPERVPVKNSNTGGSKVSTHSYITRRVRFASKYKNTTSSSNLKLSKSLRNKSLYGALGMSGTMPRRLSRMLLSLGNDSIKKKSKSTIPQIGYDEFNRITRKYSREIVKNVLFVPSDEIRIVRLSKERFFSSEEIVDVLLECSSVKQDHNNSGEVTNNEPSDNSGLKYKRPTNKMSATEDEDTFDEDDVKPAPIFRRGLTRETSSFSRLSTAIRRSLRLPARSSSIRSSREKEDNEWETLRKKDTYPRFTKNSDTYVGASSVPSKIDEIRENLRLNRTDTVKKIVRKAEWPVRHEVRRELWRILCHSKDYDSSKTLYRTELEETVRSGTKSHQPQFLSEEGVVVNNFNLNEQGAVRLLRLLTVIEHLRPEISSAPMLYPLCALMLHYLEDEDVFACVQHLLVSKGYLMTSPVQWSASSYTILSLIKKHKPRAYAMLKRQVGTADDSILVKTTRDWLSWIFSGLPFNHVVRIIDCYLVEGQKFLTRAAIAIVYIWAKSLKNRPTDDLHGKSQEERIEAVKLELANIAQQMQISTETFIQTAVRIRNLQSSTITRLQTQFENKVREDVNRRQTQKRALPRRARHLFTQPFSSAIVDQDAAAEIMSSFPPRLQLATPQLLFRLSTDGASFTHLWSKIDQAEQTLLLIKTTTGEKFGAYCSSSWAERNDRRERSKSKYFGTGESFVWVLEEELELPIIYGWVGNNNEHPDACPQMFMAAGDKLLVIGSGDGDAIRISEELTHGMSSACRTFGSPALVQSRSFDIHELEVFDVLTGS